MKRGFTISVLCWLDGQFEMPRSDLAEMQRITLNTVSNGEHMPDIELHICMLRTALVAYTTLPHSCANASAGRH